MTPVEVDVPSPSDMSLWAGGASGPICGKVFLLQH